MLKYRLPDDRHALDKSIAPLQDAQQAIKIVRQRAAEWHLDPDKIGIMGFSAGGHLAAMAGTNFHAPVIENPNDINLRPDFMILVYPVISFTDSIGHRGFRDMLLGSSPTAEQIRHYSNELQVSSLTPATFLTHAGDVTVIPVENSLEFYKALQQDNVPAALHVYASGEHGYLKSPSSDEWFGRCLHWLKDMALID